MYRAFLLPAASNGRVRASCSQILHKFTVDLPKKHGRGGQSALRFARLRMEKRHNYVRKARARGAWIMVALKLPQKGPVVNWRAASPASALPPRALTVVSAPTANPSPLSRSLSSRCSSSSRLIG